MAARSTALRIAGVALASLCVSTAMPAQQLFAGWKTGCFGVVCVPATGLGLLPGSGSAPEWAGYGSPAAQNALAAKIARVKNGSNKSDEGGSDLDDTHLDKTVAASTGIAFVVAVSVLNSQNGRGQDTDNQDDTPTFSAPLNAHLEIAQTSDVIANPEPSTQALMASGLLVIGAAAVRRRRRKSIA